MSLHPISRLLRVPLAVLVMCSLAISVARPPRTTAARSSHPYAALRPTLHLGGGSQIQRVPATRPALPAASPAAPTMLAQRSGPFTATIVQGPEHGQSLTGTLKLQLWTHGVLTGSLLSKHRAPVPVQGQLKGQMIGLFLNLGPGRSIFGTGMIGYDRFQKRTVIGGTFTGPRATATGVWEYYVSDFCTTGIAYGRIVQTGQLLCYVIDAD